MFDRLKLHWLFTKNSLWFVPLLMSIAAIALALSLTSRASAPPDIPFLRPLLFNGDVDSARSLLSALLSAMITMSTLVVSITMVVLALAAAQLGPRVIRYFMGDKVTQLALGVFISTILYILVVLRGLNEERDFSDLAVTVATVLSGFCVFVLLFFIHRLSTSIMADNVVQRVNQGFIKSIHAILPERHRGDDRVPVMPKDRAWIEFEGQGYIQAFDGKKLLAAAKAADVVIWLRVRPGHYLLPRGEQIAVTPEAACDPALVEEIRRAVLLGGERTPAQDLEFSIRQLVEIGLRALSPGINDPFTAIIVLDYLMGGLAIIFGRGLEHPIQRDDDGALRLVRLISDEEGLVGAAFNQLRQAGRSKPAILLHMTDNIAALAPFVRYDSQRQPLLLQIDAIATSAQESDWIAADLSDLNNRLGRARAALERPFPSDAPMFP